MAWLLDFALLSSGAATTVTDMPGFYYIPTFYAFVTLIGLSACVLSIGGTWIWRKVMKTSPTDI